MAPKNLDRLTRVYGPATWDVYHLLDQSLDPEGPDSLFDVAGQLIKPGDLVLDAGCRDGAHLIELAQRFDITGLGVEPVAAQVERAQAAAAAAGLNDRLAFHEGVIHDIAAADHSVDFVWCRDVLEQVDDLSGALRDVVRVAKPGAAMLAYTTVVTSRLTNDERSMLGNSMGNVDENLDRAFLEAAFAEAAMTVESCRSIGTEWREQGEEQHQIVSKALLRLARLRRQELDIVAEHGQDIFDHVEANLHWELFQFLGKLEGLIYVLRMPDTMSDPASAT